MPWISFKALKLTRIALLLLSASQNKSIGQGKSLREADSEGRR